MPKARLWPEDQKQLTDFKQFNNCKRKRRLKKNG